MSTPFSAGPGAHPSAEEPAEGWLLQSEPLLVTLVLDDAAQQHYDRLRRQHFPVERNHLAAHVTLFHALPGEQRPAVRVRLEAACQRPAIEVKVTGVRLLGRGVAYVLHSPELAALRAGLASDWQPWLTPQDRQPWRPHVTVQNKVPPEAARELHSQLAAGFQSGMVTGCGLALWRYLGGPWEPVARYPFHG